MADTAGNGCGQFRIVAVCKFCGFVVGELDENTPVDFKGDLDGKKQNQGEREA